jgi:hypothetical protein
MASINVYVDNGEKAFVKEQHPGYVRGLIKRDRQEKADIKSFEKRLKEPSEADVAGSAIEAGKMMDETLLKIEGVEDADREKERRG